MAKTKHVTAPSVLRPRTSSSLDEGSNKLKKVALLKLSCEDEIKFKEISSSDEIGVHGHFRRFEDIHVQLQQTDADLVQVNREYDGLKLKYDNYETQEETAICVFFAGLIAYWSRLGDNYQGSRNLGNVNWLISHNSI